MSEPTDRELAEELRKIAKGFVAYGTIHPILRLAASRLDDAFAREAEQSVLYTNATEQRQRAIAAEVTLARLARFVGKLFYTLPLTPVDRAACKKMFADEFPGVPTEGNLTDG